jgi:GT2 family glycosyltransferase
VTYGPFRPNGEGSEYHTPEVVDRDLVQMSEHGINTVRTYTVPPRWLLDLATDHGLRVMVGLEWGQHIAFLDEKKRPRSIEDRVRAGVRACADHPAVLCYAIGNEIPATIVRWYGQRRIERFLERLYKAVKDEDPRTLVTYVNYPTTEYVQLDFLDFSCFNVYLESPDKFKAYLARLQNLVDEKPLVMAEIGLDSRRNGEDVQAETLDWQVRTAFASGCAGAFVFSWTDEWHRGGFDIKDWDFGLTHRDRSPKPALATVARAFDEVPFPAGLNWPQVSVVVCSYNGAQTIDDCLDGLQKLAYPNYKVIVVNDGSTDSTQETVQKYGFQQIVTENRGLSSARNTGMRAAQGDIVAYIDDDACPDPHWLHYLAASLMRSGHAGVGGPNIPPPGDGAVADCVSNAPGGPAHVLVSDWEAEHIPGCNMAFWRTSLQAVGGFDTQFRIAGDDVDLCWRLQNYGWTLGFHPAAVVWHHCRDSVKAYWKQQLNYGRAEAMLEIKYPERYNAFGHPHWQGRLYGRGRTWTLSFRRWRVYHGVWGSALFQSIYETAPGKLSSMLLHPEWYLVIAGLLGLSLLGILWWPLLVAAPLAILAVGALLWQCILSAQHASFAYEPLSVWRRLKRYILTVFLCLLQPLARLVGRLHYGLTPWRRRGKFNFVSPRPRTSAIWSEHWRALDKRLETVETAIRAQGAVVTRGGEYDRWDMEVRGGPFGALRCRATVEEHGGGKQLIRIRSWPWFDPSAITFTLLFALLAALAAVDQAAIVAGLLALVAVAVAVSGFVDCATATTSFLHALRVGKVGGGQLVNDRGERSRDSLRLGMRVLSAEVEDGLMKAREEPIRDMPRSRAAGGNS